MPGPIQEFVESRQELVNITNESYVREYEGKLRTEEIPQRDWSNWYRSERDLVAEIQSREQQNVTRKGASMAEETESRTPPQGQTYDSVRLNIPGETVTLDQVSVLPIGRVSEEKFEPTRNDNAEENKRSRRLTETTGLSFAEAREQLRNHVFDIRFDPDPDTPRHEKQQLRLAAEEIRLGQDGVINTSKLVRPEQGFEQIRNDILGQEERLREQFVASLAAGDTSKSGYFVAAATEINREIEQLGERFPRHQETLPPLVNVQQLEEQFRAQNREFQERSNQGVSLSI